MSKHSYKTVHGKYAKIDINQVDAINMFLAMRRGEANVEVNLYGSSNITQAYRETLVNIAKQIASLSGKEQRSVDTTFRNLVNRFEREREISGTINTNAKKVKVVDDPLLKDVGPKNKKQKVIVITEALDKMIGIMEQENIKAGELDPFTGYVNRNVSGTTLSFGPNAVNNVERVNYKQVLHDIEMYSGQLLKLSNKKAYIPTGAGRKAALDPKTREMHRGYAYFKYNVADTRISNLFKALDKMGEAYNSLKRLIADIPDTIIYDLWREHYKTHGENLFEIVFAYDPNADSQVVKKIETALVRYMLMHKSTDDIIYTEEVMQKINVWKAERRVKSKKEAKKA